MKKDSIGNRMKDNYESVTRYKLPRRTNTIIRVDGKAFHTYTKKCTSPFDGKFMDDMDKTAIYLCENIQGAKLAFVQSDEISIILTDYDKLNTSAWFDGNIQKMASVSASLATAKFNTLRIDYGVLAMFDSRIFIIPEIEEVYNYFIWRQQDTVRNSISSLAQSLYSQKQLHGKNCSQMQDMCIEKGSNWNDFSAYLKRGRCVIKSVYSEGGADRSKWVVDYHTPTFTQDEAYLPSNIFH